MVRRLLLILCSVFALASMAAWVLSYQRSYFVFRPIPTEPTWFYVQRAKLHSGRLETTIQSARQQRSSDASSITGWPDRWRFSMQSLQIVIKEPCGYYGTSFGKSFSIFIHEVRLTTPILPLVLIFSTWPAIWLLRTPTRRRKLRARRGLCEKCGYNLTGNSTGLCPECGTKVVP